MINEKAIENIRTYGVYQDSGAGRYKVLFEDLGLNADKKAEYLIIAGCVQPEGMPNVFSALKNIFEQLHISYTFLSKEFCCGWMPLGQPAVMAKNEEDIAKSKEIAKGVWADVIGKLEARGKPAQKIFDETLRFLEAYK